MEKLVSIGIAACTDERPHSREVRTVSLARREVLVLSDVECDLQILCATGVIWITQDGDPEDYILERGERFTVTRPGRVVIQGMRDR
jgi:hypothetical protein